MSETQVTKLNNRVVKQILSLYGKNPREASTTSNFISFDRTDIFFSLFTRKMIVYIIDSLYISIYVLRKISFRHRTKEEKWYAIF